MGLRLQLDVSPDRLRLDTASDLELRLRLTTDARVTIYPAAAKLEAIVSYAGVGITWGVSLAGPDGAVPIKELRTWYGPPGNPPAPSWVKRDAIELRPGVEHVITLPACWIPNAEIDPASLDPKLLDPQGMDNISGPGFVGHPPLVELVALARCSVIAFAPLGQLDRSKVDFLRGRVVAFVPAAGSYELTAAYQQFSFMGVGENVQAIAPAVPIVIG